MPIFGILVNILVTKILKVLAKCFIFSTKNLFGDNIELVDFHSNRLIGILAGGHKRNRFFVCVVNFSEDRWIFRSQDAEESDFVDDAGRWTTLIG